jgi:ArsR family transcriptional regulator
MLALTKEDRADLAANAARAARMLRVLSHETRLMVLCQLADGEMQAGDMQAQTGLSQSAFSQHLAKLRDEGLVATRREGTTIFYRVANPDALKIIETLAAIYCKPKRTKS